MDVAGATGGPAVADGGHGEALSARAAAAAAQRSARKQRQAAARAADAGRLAAAFSKICALEAELAAVTAALAAANGEASTQGELVGRLALAAPVLAEDLEARACGREAHAAPKAKALRNTGLHNLDVPVKELARMGLTELNRVQREGRRNGSRRGRWPRRQPHLDGPSQVAVAVARLQQPLF